MYTHVNLLVHIYVNVHSLYRCVYINVYNRTRRTCVHYFNTYFANIIY